MLQTVPGRTVAANLALVRRRIAAAADRSGRRIEDVRLVAVTKSVDRATTEALFEHGVTDLGENRLQAALPKVDAIGDGPTWHFIGRLQSNKIRKIVPRFAWIHALTSIDVLARIARVAEELAVPAPRVLVQVNVTDEASKQGLSPGDVRDLLGAASAIENAKVVGLMTMARYDPDPEASRPAFATLRALRDDACRDGWYRAPLEELSMGMSNDYPIAVEEGATLVRVGSALYESNGGAASGAAHPNG